MDRRHVGCDRRLFLHAGLPKTGTSAIQRALSALADPLAAAGHHYPRCGRAKKLKLSAQHHNLAFEFYDPVNFDPDSGGRDVRDETAASGIPNLIVSSEAFRAALAPDVAATLRDLFPDHRPTIVLYLRAQWEYVESAYNQVARFGRADTDVDGFWREVGAKVTDYRKIVETWRAHFGDDAVVCIPFDARIRRFGAETHFVRDVLDLALPVPRDAELTHPKAGMRAIGAVEFCRDHYPGRVGDPFAMLPGEAVKKIMRRMRRSEDDMTSSFLSPELAEEIFLPAVPTNRWLADTYPAFDAPTFLVRPDFRALRPVGRLPRLERDEETFCLELARSCAAPVEDANAPRDQAFRCGIFHLPQVPPEGPAAPATSLAGGRA